MRYACAEHDDLKTVVCKLVSVVGEHNSLSSPNVHPMHVNVQELAIWDCSVWSRCGKCRSSPSINHSKRDAVPHNQCYSKQRSAKVQAVDDLQAIRLIRCVGVLMEDLIHDLCSRQSPTCTPAALPCPPFQLPQGWSLQPSHSFHR